MRKTFIISALIAVTASSIAIGWSTFQSNQSQPPPLVHRQGTPLSEIIERRARVQSVIVVEKDQPPPLAVEPPAGVGQLEWLTSITTVVLMVRVTNLDSRLTPGRDWVMTTVRAQVLEVPRKPAGDPLSVGDAITFEQDGGDIRVGPTLVRAVLPYAAALQQGEKYLMFGLRNPADSTLILSPMEAYHIGSRDELMPLAKAGPGRSVMGIGVPQALDRIRSVKGEK